MEDLLSGPAPTAQPAVVPPQPVVQQPEPSPPPPVEDNAASIEQVLGAMSEEEKAAILAEQAKIMASIEKSKASPAAAAADAFEQRSFVNAVQTVNNGGNEVGDAASAALTKTDEERQQVDTDHALAEQLQKEEYRNAQRQQEAAQQQQQQRAAQQQQSQPAQSAGQSWSEWLGLSGGTNAAVPPQQQPQRPLARGELGVSLPPGSTIVSQSPSRDNIRSPRSYDEQDNLLLNNSRDGGGLPAARVAQSQPLFSCVADGITQAATSLTTALNTTTLSSDREGNVHGVDSSGLLGGGGGGGGGNYSQLPDRERN